MDGAVPRCMMPGAPLVPGTPITGVTELLQDPTPACLALHPDVLHAKLALSLGPGGVAVSVDTSTTAAVPCGSRHGC